MNILVLNRNTPQRAPFHDWLADAGREKRLFTAADRVTGFSGFSDIRSFDDYETNPLVELEVFRLSQSWRIHRIVATSEADILRAGRLRTYLGIPGQDAESARAFRDKLRMKTLLNGRLKSTRVPAFQAVEDSLDLLEFIELHGYPIVVKPVDGSASVNTHVLDGDSDLEMLLRQGIGRGLEVEAFVKGDQYHVDGLVVDGALLFLWPSRYSGDGLSFSRGGMTGSSMLSADNPLHQRLCDATREILDVLPTPPSTSFHLELFHTPEDELVFCEIASRTGGGRINDTLELAFGINLNKVFIQAQAGVPIDPSSIRSLGRAAHRLLGFGLVPPRAGVLHGFRQGRPDWPWIVDYRWTMHPGDVSHGPEHSVDAVASCIVELDEQHRGEERLQAVRQWADENAVWS